MHEWCNGGTRKDLLASFLTTGEIQIASRETWPVWAKTTSSQGRLGGNDSRACLRQCRSTHSARRIWRAWTRRWVEFFPRQEMRTQSNMGGGRGVSPFITSLKKIAHHCSFCFEFPLQWLQNAHLSPRWLPFEVYSMLLNKIAYNGTLNTLCPVAACAGFRRTPPTATWHFEANLAAEARSSR